MKYKTFKGSVTHIQKLRVGDFLMFGRERVHRTESRGPNTIFYNRTELLPERPKPEEQKNESTNEQYYVDKKYYTIPDLLSRPGSS